MELSCLQSLAAMDFLSRASGGASRPAGSLAPNAFPPYGTVRKRIPTFASVSLSLSSARNVTMDAPKVLLHLAPVSALLLAASCARTYKR